MTVSAIGTAAIFLLLFVYVFGDAIGAGMGLAAGAPGGRYVDYLMPGVLVFAIGGIGSATAINLVGDTSTGIVDRFRTMPIAHGSVLTGQFLGSLVRAVVAVVLVLAAGLAVGFRPQADAGDWWVLAGLLLLLTTAVIWIATCFGLMAKTEAGANSSSLLLQFGAFLSSAFVPTALMTPAVAWFAERQPFTAFIDTSGPCSPVRGRATRR
jgi:ABC-2 type transport system permease protein